MKVEVDKLYVVFEGLCPVAEKPPTDDSTEPVAAGYGDYGDYGDYGLEVCDEGQTYLENTLWPLEDQLFEL
jgi:hypothetical protein